MTSASAKDKSTALSQEKQQNAGTDSNRDNEGSSRSQGREENNPGQQHAQNQRERFRLTANAPAVIARYDRSLRCIYANHGCEKLTARSASWFMGRLLDDFVGYPEAAIAKTKSAILAVFETGQTQTRELTLEKPWGEVTFLQTYYPEYDASGSIETVVGIGLDTSERTRARQELERALEQREYFITMSSHELRNPLAAISSALRILDTGPEPETQETSRALMHRQLAHITRLINDLLDSTQVERGEITFYQAPTSVGDIVRLALDITRLYTNSSSHTFLTRLQDLDVLVNGDLNRLAQVISNLIHNAYKFTPTGGTIQLESAQEGNNLVIRVRDSGSGLTPAHIENLFAKYQRFTTNPGRYSDGMGLGLYLSKNILERHNGTISVSSPGLNQGSVFEISIPLPTSLASFEPQNSDSSLECTSSSYPPILLVDDNEAGALTMKMLLELQGHDVTVAKNGYEAISLFEKLKPSVVLLDMGLPDIDGCVVAKEIRTRTRDSQEPLIVAMTGWGRAQDKEQSISAGCDVHLTKPIDFDELTRVLNSRE